MGWDVIDLGICDQFQMPLAIAVNRQQIIERAVHFDRVKVILVNLLLSLQPTLACPRFCRG